VRLRPSCDLPGCARTPVDVVEKRTLLFSCGCNELFTLCGPCAVQTASSVLNSANEALLESSCVACPACLAQVSAAHGLAYVVLSEEERTLLGDVTAALERGRDMYLSCLPAVEPGASPQRSASPGVGRDEAQEQRIISTHLNPHLYRLASFLKAHNGDSRSLIRLWSDYGPPPPFSVWFKSMGDQLYGMSSTIYWEKEWNERNLAEQARPEAAREIDPPARQSVFVTRLVPIDGKQLQFGRALFPEDADGMVKVNWYGTKIKGFPGCNGDTAQPTCTELCMKTELIPLIEHQFSSRTALVRWSCLIPTELFSDQLHACVVRQWSQFGWPSHTLCGAQYAMVVGQSHRQLSGNRALIFGCAVSHADVIGCGADSQLVGVFAGSVAGKRDQRLALVRYAKGKLVVVMAANLRHIPAEDAGLELSAGLPELLHVVRAYASSAFVVGIRRHAQLDGFVTDLLFLPLTLTCSVYFFS
jgi:hypothetical protein